MQHASFLQILGQIQDAITQLNNLEDEIQEMHFLQHLIDTIPSPVYYKDTNGFYVGCNKAYEEGLGFTKSQIIGKTFFDIAPREVAEANARMDKILLENPGIQCYDGVLPFADGSLHDVIYNKATVHGVSNQLLGLVAVTVDITERKRAEEALSISEEKFRNIFSQSPIGIILTDNNGILLEANQAALNIFGGKKPEDFIGAKILEDPSIPEDAKQKIKAGQSVRFESKYCYDIVTECNGSQTIKTQTNYLDSSVTPLKLPKISSGGFLVQVQDITKKKQAQLALKNSENQLRSITTNMRDIILQINPEGIIEYISPSCKIVLGYEPDVMLGKNLADFMTPEDYSLVKVECCSKIIFRHQHENGQWLWLEAIGSPLLDDNNQKIGVVFSIRDVTERERIEKEMARLDRLRLSGEIAASIGHEIRNPLTTVQGFLQMLRNEPSLTEFQSYFDLMFDELNATNTIINEFLSLAQNKKIFLQKQNLNNLVKNFYPLITAEATKSEKSVTWEPGEITDVSVDGNEIRQLLLNLALNGFEAMEPGGKLEIKTYMDADNVVLSFKDQGPGISPEVIDKLGTPFATTKDNGTGLGLAVCYSIAARHHATIDFKTGPDGTTFLVRFKQNYDPSF